MNPAKDPISFSRAAKSRRARTKADVLSSGPYDYMRVRDLKSGSTYVWDVTEKLESILLRFRPALSSVKIDRMMIVTDLAVNQLVGAREATRLNDSETTISAEVALKNVLAGAATLHQALSELKEQRGASSKFDETLRAYLRKFGEDSQWLPPRTDFAQTYAEMPIHFSMSLALIQLTNLIKPIVDDLSEASLIRQPHEYACAGALALTWLECTRRLPTLTRNYGSTSTLFQEFVEAAIPPPTIGEDILRCAIAEVRQNARSGVRMWIENGRLKTEPDPQSRLDRARSLASWLRENFGVGDPSKSSLENP